MFLVRKGPLGGLFISMKFLGVFNALLALFQGFSVIGEDQKILGVFPVLLFLGLFENTKENLENTKDFLTLRTLKNPGK